MSRGMKAVLCLVMAAAVGMIVLVGSGILRDAARARNLSRELSESRASWEDTAERKEALQEELKGVTEELKEAKLTLEESTTRAEELQQDIEELETEIAELKQQLPSETP